MNSDIDSKSVRTIIGRNGPALASGDIPSPLVEALLQTAAGRGPLPGVLIGELDHVAQRASGLVGCRITRLEGQFILLWIFNGADDLVRAIEVIRPITLTPLVLCFEAEGARDAFISSVDYIEPYQDERFPDELAAFASGVNGCVCAVFADVFRYSLNTAFLWVRSDLAGVS